MSGLLVARPLSLRWCQKCYNKNLNIEYFTNTEQTLHVNVDVKKFRENRRAPLSTLPTVSGPQVVGDALMNGDMSEHAHYAHNQQQHNCWFRQATKSSQRSFGFIPHATAGVSNDQLFKYILALMQNRNRNWKNEIVDSTEYLNASFFFCFSLWKAAALCSGSLLQCILAEGIVSSPWELLYRNLILVI